MRLLALLLFFSGCAHIHDPQPIDTIFKPQVKNWEKIYADELKAAIANEDDAAFYFFWPEYLKEIEKNKLSSVNQD